ncbi:protein translocase subunit SecD [Acidocella sp.]|uniref:protein translocase subunit SecD n=1 Tax=Acidocella sp. TaxID=50710 RepID=UPI00261739C9|nr:protein translocase subunit SecD [Acidocella sp.]
MLYFSRLKTALILGACILGVLLSIPNLFAEPSGGLPWRTIRLGLDLRGGSYLLMEVDMGAVIKERLNGLADGARRALERAHVRPYALVIQPAQDRLLVKPGDPAQRDAASAALKGLQATEQQGIGARPDLEIQETPEGVAVALSQTALIERATQAVQQSIEIVRRRIDETGVVDPIITRQGRDRIVVQLPGINDPDRIKQLLGKTAHMTFQLVDESANPAAPVPPPGVAFLPLTDKPGQKLAVFKRVEVDGGDLTDARAGQNPQTGDWVVNFTFNSVGARRFADVTRQNVGHPFAIVLDNKIISAPVIREPITGGRGQISGNFTAASATDLSVLLRAGALPAPLTVVEERSIGPELGADAIRAGAISLGVGFVFVIVFMGLFYGLFGWIANLALVFNLFLMLAILSLLQATLTLPGMAGILLTLGMAVDANVLINERVREETKLGKKPLAALEAGYKRAYATIIDSNVTTLLAHITLFIFGSPPVRGFAVTICVGIITTIFTATVLVRLITARWYIARRPAQLPV